MRLLVKHLDEKVDDLKKGVEPSDEAPMQLIEEYING